MIIHVKVKTSSSEQKIEDFGDHRYLVYLKSEPRQNEANIELIRLLSKYFGTPSQRIKIKFGSSSSEKMIEVS